MAYFTSFLGRYNDPDATPSKSFQIEQTSEFVLVEFRFYEIDSWDGDSDAHGKDKFNIIVSGDVTETVDIGFFSHGASEIYSGSTIEGIVWASHHIDDSSDRGFDSYNDQKHLVTLKIPPSFFSSGGKIALDFRFIVNELSGFNEAGGIDDFLLTECAMRLN